MANYVRDTGRGARNLLHSVARLTDKQFGVVSLEQVVACGLTYEQVRGLVARGFLYPIHRGVYAVGHPKVGRWGLLMAAYLACSTDSFLSHRTSAATRGLREIDVRRIELTVIGGCARQGLIIHRAHKLPHAEDVTTKNGIRISSLPRMFIELAPTETPQELERLITVRAPASNC